MKYKTGFILILILSFAGFLDSLYLTFNHLYGAIPDCGVVDGCDTVTTSEYSEIAGIPIAIPGTLFYLFVFLMSVLWFDKQPKWIPTLLTGLAFPAFLFSAWLVYLQLFVIEAICIFCMFSAFTSTSIFIISALLKFKGTQ